jgi:serine/threonine protein kinase
MSSITTPTTLAGFRLVRRLGTGTRAEVFLGVAVDDSSGLPRTAALKVFRPDLPREDAGRELESLGRASLPHVVRLLDVSLGPSGLPLLILDRIGRGSLAALLAERQSIEAGEAVTILAPLCTTLTDLHRLGVVHSAVSAASVHFGLSGEPILIGFGRSIVLQPDLSLAALDSVAPVIVERDRLAALATGVLSRVRDGHGLSALRDLQGWLADSAGGRRFEFAVELGERLFGIADSIPIAFAGVDGARRLVPGRLDAASVPVPVPVAVGVPVSVGVAVPVPIPVPVPVANAGSEMDAAMRRRPRAAGSANSAEVFHAESGRHRGTARVSGTLVRVLAVGPGEILGSARQRALDLVHGVRARFWVASGAVVVALIAAIALVPESEAASGAAPTSAGPSSAGASATATASSSSSSPDPRANPALSIDPLAALTGLLVARAECFRQLSVLCLDAVDEPLSDAHSADAAAILAVRAGGEVPADAALLAPSPTLIERLGDSVLVALGPESTPASVLVIRTEAGWRIHSFQGGTPVSAGSG